MTMAIREVMIERREVDEKVFIELCRQAEIPEDDIPEATVLQLDVTDACVN
jgi:hypothetical protein